MPGILPMKVIKVGNNPQSRIAQACDRCRSKKIRCDGIRPCCSQCSAVGFECKTSDKLSRRAFPRGYTESLEERVRSLEAEVRELKGLLDEKDEKIELLSRIHSFASPSQKTRSPAQASPSPAAPGPIASPESSRPTVPDEGTIRVQPPSSPSAKRPATTPFAGPSSVRAFSNTLTTKVVERGTPLSSIPTTSLNSTAPKTFQSPSSQLPALPPRMASDQLVSIYFQEWAPLYPVVHRPTILKAYDSYVTKSKSLQSEPHLVAQLNLIFGIATLSSKSRVNQDPALFEKIWYPLVELLSGDPSIPAVQCLVLAQMYCLVKGDYQSLSRYRSMSIGIAQVLGLYQSQAPLALNPLATETRKKVFWCQFILDRFAAAATGLPTMLREADIDTELPADVDDENITENGFVPAVPGESTRLSTALALLEASKILGRVLETLYPPAAAHEVPVSKLRGLTEELDTWHGNLPSHLKLVFSQDKPSANVTGSRSPLISLVYYYIRALIHRPAACFGNPALASASILVISDSSKHVIQILDLLDERCLSLSLAVNRLEVIFSAGLGLLWQSLGLKRDSKLAKETQKTLLATRKQMELESKAAAAEFRTLTNAVTGSNDDRQQPSPSANGQSLSPKKAMQSLHSRLSAAAHTENAKGQGLSRRNTVSGSEASRQAQQAQANHHPHQMRAASHQAGFQPLPGKRRTVDLTNDTPVDFYPVDGNNVRATPSTDPSSMPLSTADWELILGDLDRGQANIFNGIYGGRECAAGPSPFDAVLSGYPNYAASYTTTESVRPASQELSPNTWSPGSGELSHGFDGSSQSVHSRSEDGLGSTEDLLATENMGMQPAGGMNMGNSLKGLMIPTIDDDFIDLGFFDGWEQQLATA